MKKILAILTMMLFCCVLLFSYQVNSIMGMNYDFEVSVHDAEKFPILIPREQQILVEVFSAVWCGWCYYAYDIYERLSTTYGLPIHHVRYYNQDSLAMREAPQRTGFYKVTGFPTMIINGNKKIVGANEHSYHQVDELVKESLNEEPLVGVYSYGQRMGDKLKMVAYVQAFTEQEFEVRFLSVLMENNVKGDKDKTYNYVARAVFPDYNGLRLSISPDKIYRIEFFLPIHDQEKALDYKITSFVQCFDNGKIFNSSFFELNSLTMASHQPLDFADNVPRDGLLSIQFNDPLSVSSIKNELFYMLDETGQLIQPSIEYRPSSRTILVDPGFLLQSNTAYVLFIDGGRNALSSSSRKHIRDYFCLPFQTGDSPDIQILFSENELDFGNISNIDESVQSVTIVEDNDHPLRLSWKSSDRWIDAALEEITPSHYLLKVMLNPLHMKTGKNEGSLTVTTITGAHIITVKALLESNEFPAIRIDTAPFVTIHEKIRIQGRTNGYRLYIGNEEIKLDQGGYFDGWSPPLISGMNVVVLRAVNMQRKESKRVIIIFRI
jgi:thiol-disulfide isomerase/thioredoxin